MKYDVQILPSAWEDLKGIQDYYLLEFGEETAKKVTDSILSSINQLETFPGIGSKTPDEWLNKQGYKMVICREYISIYRLIEKTVYIYHIASTKTLYTKLFY